MTAQYITGAGMAHMRAAVVPIYMDTCQRLVYTEGTTGAYGTPVITYVAGASIECLFVAKPKPDVLQGTEVLRIDADLYLPRGATLNPHDRVKITHLHGDAVESPQTFAVNSGPLVDHVTAHAGLTLVVE